MRKGYLKKTISAGGIVRKVIDGQVYIVLTTDDAKHDWLLPKGHQEKGETIEETALREVKEETGLNELRIIKKLGTKRRISYEGDELKTIHYFLFDYLGNKIRRLEKVRHGEEFLIPKWFPLNNLPKLFWKEQEEIINESLKTIKEFY